MNLTSGLYYRPHTSFIYSMKLKSEKMLIIESGGSNLEIWN